MPYLSLVLAGTALGSNNTFEAALRMQADRGYPKGRRRRAFDARTISADRTARDYNAQLADIECSSTRTDSIVNQVSVLGVLR
jgi:hypothetical protein